MQLKSLFNDKRIKLVFIAGIALILLIGLSQLIGQKPADTATAEGEFDLEQYRKESEGRISELVGAIDGVGEIKVLITFKGGPEYVYAKQEKQNIDITNDAAGSGKALQQRDQHEQSIMMVEDKNGRKTALIRTTLEPQVMGVVVVCEGGGDILVQQAVTDAVKTALGIGANRVCVKGLAKGYEGNAE